MAKSLIGETLGGYQITDQIGKGGMATIYKAFQPSLEREVAIKILPPYYAEQDESFIARFKREAKAIANLQHQNILMVMDTGRDGDYFYIVMEYIPAGTLKELINERPLSLKEISNLINQMADALDYAHGKGVVHRDIKPSNILMRRDDWALLTDFGLAKMVGGSLLTQSGMTVGTPAYMSPEQGSGATIDSRTDIYALGVMLYEMTVGEVPYTAETPMAVVIKHITEPLPMPRAKNPDLPEEVQRIILKALAKSPDDRYQTAGDMAKALAEAANGAPDWAANGIDTLIDEAAAGALPPASTLVHEESAEEPAAVAVETAPVETLVHTPAGSTQVAAQGGRNPWKWVAIAMGVIAILLIGIFGTIAFMNGQEEQAVADDAPATEIQPNVQPDIQPSNPPDSGNGNGQPGNGANGGLGVIPLPPPPPDDMLVYDAPWEQAFELMEAGEFGQARMAFYQALLEEPNHWEEFIGVIDTAYEDIGPGFAAELLTSALQTVPDAADYLENYSWLGWLRLEADQPGGAMQAFAYVINQALDDPEYSEAYDGFYYAVSESERRADGIRYLERLEESGVENSALFNVMANLFDETGESDRALALRQRAVEVDSDNSWLHVDLAYTYIDIDDYGQAEVALARAFELGIHDPYVFESIGWAYLEMEMYGQAEESFHRFIEMNSDDPWGFMGLAWVYLYGDYNQGEIPNLVDEAYQRGQEDAPLLTDIGWLFQDSDNCEQAVPFYEEALALDPGYYDAEEGIRECGE